MDTLIQVISEAIAGEDIIKVIFGLKDFEIKDLTFIIKNLLSLFRWIHVIMNFKFINSRFELLFERFGMSLKYI